MNLPERFESKIAYCPTSGCWLWLGCMDRHGYGQLRRPGGKMSVAHKVIYEYLHGAVGKGFELDHFVCSNRACVNPQHLKVVSHKDNLLRSSTSLNAINAAKICCQKCGGNYSTKKSGFRFCRPCALARQRSNYYTKRAKRLGEKKP